MWATNVYKIFSKKFLLYMSSRLSKIRSVYTYVMPRPRPGRFILVESVAACIWTLWRLELWKTLSYVSYFKSFPLNSIVKL